MDYFTLHHFTFYYFSKPILQYCAVSMVVQRVTLCTYSITLQYTVLQYLSYKSVLSVQGNTEPE